MDMHECIVDSNTAGPSRIVRVALELPGLKREAVRLEVRNGQLVVEGDRPPPTHAHRAARRTALRHSPDFLSGPGVPPPSESLLLSAEESCRPAVAEMRYGRFRRVLTLPPGLNVSHLLSSDCSLMLTQRRQP
jgi:HSP20 family molecular chaperone IbpA